jgi:hypothetical protein
VIEIVDRNGLPLPSEQDGIVRVRSDGGDPLRRGMPEEARKDDAIQPRHRACCGALSE